MNMNEGPADPFNSLIEGAAQMNEVYLSFVKAGFTPEQSMQLICTMMSEVIRLGIVGNM